MSTDEDYSPSNDISDEEYIPIESKSKSNKKTKAKSKPRKKVQRKKRKRNITNDCSENEQEEQNNLEQEIEDNHSNNSDTNIDNNKPLKRPKKRSRVQFERNDNQFQEEQDSYFLRSIDEEADNIEQFESELIAMTNSVEMEYKRNQNHNNSVIYSKEISQQCQEPYCNSVTICPVYLKQFGIHVCRECRWKPKYKCITKTGAKKEYLLSEGDINSLRCWVKEMKQNQDNNDGTQVFRARYMKLYLVYQLEELAIEKWGSKEGIEVERNRREVNKWQRNISNARKKRKVKFECLNDIEIDHKGIEELQKERTHIHKFGEAQCINPDTDEWSKTCLDCGYVETWEEF